MNVVIDRPEARSLPSRHRFALARLIAFVRLRSERPAADRPEHLVLPIDRDQSAVEVYTIAVWVFLTTASYFAASLPLPLLLAILAAIPLTFLALHVPVVGGGLALRLLLGDKDHVSIISAGGMAMLLIWSLFVARSATWARYAAWFFLAVLAGNGVAKVILWLLNPRVQAAEDGCAL
jgi:hypothetical protein